MKIFGLILLSLGFVTIASASNERLTLYVAKEAGNTAVQLKRLKTPSSNKVSKPSKEEKAVSFSIVLNKITAINVSEKHGDELFFDCLVTSPNTKPAHFRIPHYPHHWPTKALEKISNVPLVQGQLKLGEKRTFTFSLLEQDAPPWNTNDLVGTFHLDLYNNSGQLMHKLKRVSEGKRVLHKMPDSPSKSYSFTLSGGGASYRVDFSIK